MFLLSLCVYWPFAVTCPWNAVNSRFCISLNLHGIYQRRELKFVTWTWVALKSHSQWLESRPQKTCVVSRPSGMQQMKDETLITTIRDLRLDFWVSLVFTHIFGDGQWFQSHINLEWLYFSRWNINNTANGLLFEAWFLPWHLLGTFYFYQEGETTMQTRAFHRMFTAVVVPRSTVSLSEAEHLSNSSLFFSLYTVSTFFFKPFLQLHFLVFYNHIE